MPFAQRRLHLRDVRRQGGGRKGIALLEQFQALLPAETQVILLGDGEFDSVELQGYLRRQQWHYVCRTAKDTWVCVEGGWFQLDDCALPDLCLGLEAVRFTAQAYGSLTVVIWWDKGYRQPIFLVSNLELTDEIYYWCRRHMRIETFFSDQKSRGSHQHKSHVAEPQRLSCILIAACLAYVWIVFLRTFAHQQKRLSVIHRTDRCELCLFQIGLDWLEHCLNKRLSIPLSFTLPKGLLLA